MIASNISKLAEDLERQELEAVHGVVAPQVYSQLLAIYLYQNDLCNAKYLWKRIPPSVKSSNPELGQIWTVGQHMWQRDFPAIYRALAAVNWAEPLADIMKALHESVRGRAVDLITQAYSSISVEAVGAMTGLGAEQAGAASAARGWPVEADSRMVRPRPPANPAPSHTSTTHQLNKLTNFVSFLEN